MIYDCFSLQYKSRNVLAHCAWIELNFWCTPTSDCHIGRLIDQLELWRIAGHLAPVLSGGVGSELLQLHVADELIAMRRTVGDGDTFNGEPICCWRC